MVWQSVILSISVCVSLINPTQAQPVEDGSETAIGKDSAKIILDLVNQQFGKLDPKVSSLRPAEGSWICGSVNVKNQDGLYIGERGFIADVPARFLGRVPEGVELLNPKAEGFPAKEHIRQLFFKMCLD